MTDKVEEISLETDPFNPLLSRKDECKIKFLECWCWTYKRSKRPTFWPILIILIPVGLICISTFPFGLLGINAYLETSLTNATVVGYNVQRSGERCITGGKWICFVVFTYTIPFRYNSSYISSKVYSKDNFGKYSMCGDYDDTACQRTARMYPLGSNFPVYFWLDDPNNLEKDDPKIYLILLILGSVLLALVIVILLMYVISVVCCGFEGLSSMECKLYDPFKELVPKHF